MEIKPNFYVDRDADSYEAILQIQRDRNKLFAEHKDKSLSEIQLTEILEDVKHRLGIPKLSLKTLQLVIQKYPMAKTELLYFGISDTEAFSQLANSIVDFFLKSTWPTYGDKIDIDKFIDVLNKEIEIYESNNLVA